MFGWKKIHANLYRFRLYGLAILLFCATLALLEANNVLPARQAPLPTATLKVADSTMLNMSRSTEFFGTVLNSSEPTQSHKTILITLQAHEVNLLAEGDVLFVPAIGYGVVKEISTRDDSVMASVAALVHIQTDLLTPGDQIHLYR